MTFKHDLKNILLSLGELQQDQLSRHVKGHIQAIISEANQAVFKRTPALEVLDQISDETVRNFLKCKAIMAYTDSHILTIFQVASPVDSFFTDNLSLIRMLGILIDNAVEACQKNDFSEYFITIKSSTTGIEIQVKNPVRENNLSLTKISTYGVSTKGTDRGIGLSSLFSLSEKSTNTRVNLSVAHHFFIATLTIYKGAVNK
ncbi:GHKL domain-containing protein [Vagococcus acidifermentans]|uniref:Sensor histidine kinase NatK-like C-terminal domain-containing protein n=1 Tax=Vagococcus acidifermentans TaxID=564710 RepID=A0A430ATX7_9ENTE|nr:GHKL domain-containing protein [Vagococcus acidifermentans]RSU11508.1 hypothetical protein CBF27_08430 [Vagococcus acidifermentans]